MKTFFVLLICIAVTQGDIVEDAKAKARANVIAAFGRAQDANKGDQKAKDRLETFEASTLELIQPAPSTGGDSPAPGGDTPAPPASGDTPAPPASGDTPAPQASGDTPAPPASGDTPAPPASGDTPAPPA